MKCSASFRLEQGLPGLPSSSKAQRGTALHAEIEKRAKGEMAVSEHRDVEVAYDAFKSLHKLFPGNRMHEFFEYFKEAKPFGNIPDACGTIDYIGVGSEHIIILDYKFGAYYVPAADNWQLKFYASLIVPPGAPQTVIGAIIQPATDPALRWARISAEELEEARTAWSDSYARASAAEPVKGKWCTFCKAKTVCPAYKPAPTTDGYTKDVMDKLDELPYSVKDVSSVDTGEQLDVWLSVYEWVKERKNYLERRAYAMLKKNEPVPGFTLVDKKRRRTWKKGSEDSVLSVLDDLREDWQFAKDYNRADYVKTQLATPPQIEKVMGRKAYGEYVSEYVENKSTGTKLVRAMEGGESTKDETGTSALKAALKAGTGGGVFAGGGS